MVRVPACMHLARLMHELQLYFKLRLASGRFPEDCSEQDPEVQPGKKWRLDVAVRGISELGVAYGNLWVLRRYAELEVRAYVPNHSSRIFFPTGSLQKRPLDV